LLPPFIQTQPSKQLHMCRPWARPTPCCWLTALGKQLLLVAMMRALPCMPGPWRWGLGAQGGHHPQCLDPQVFAGWTPHTLRWYRGGNAVSPLTLTCPHLPHPSPTPTHTCTHTHVHKHTRTQARARTHTHASTRAHVQALRSHVAREFVLRLCSQQPQITHAYAPTAPVRDQARMLALAARCPSAAPASSSSPPVTHGSRPSTARSSSPSPPQGNAHEVAPQRSQRSEGAGVGQGASQGAAAAAAAAAGGMAAGARAPAQAAPAATARAPEPWIETEADAHKRKQEAEVGS